MVLLLISTFMWLSATQSLYIVLLCLSSTLCSLYLKACLKSRLSAIAQVCCAELSPILRDLCIWCVWLAGTSASAMDMSASGAVASTASAGSEKKSRAAPSSERCLGDEWVHIQAPGQRREGPAGEMLLTRAILPNTD